MQHSPGNLQFCTSKQKLNLAKNVCLKSVPKHEGQAKRGHQGE